MSLSDLWHRVLTEPLGSAEITRGVWAFSFSVLPSYGIYWHRRAARRVNWTPAAFEPVW